MKFAHEFKVTALEYRFEEDKHADKDKEALRKEGFPPGWVESAIPYSQLKKCINRVESELRGLGLDAETLGHLIPSTTDTKSSLPPRRTSAGDAPVAFRYDFAGMNHRATTHISF